jgi:hypothetical protein
MGAAVTDSRALPLPRMKIARAHPKSPGFKINCGF